MQNRGRVRQFGLGLILLPLHFACAPAASTNMAAKSAPPADEPAQDLSTSSGESDVETAPQGPRADLLYPAPDAVPSPPTSCQQAGPLPPATPCEKARERLAEALALPPQERDGSLAKLEACQEFEPGLVRALRADLDGDNCADLLVAKVVGEKAKDSAPTLSADLQEALVGLGLAARLRRLAGEPPTAPQSREKAALDEYYKTELFPWVESQASAIYAVARQGKELRGYGKGVVALEAGNADMRFVEIVRAAPIAEEIAQYQEARDLYYATLDEQLEPRKARGSAAALVGMRHMALLGVRRSPRVDAARGLLSRAYGGRRVNALDTLLLPPVPAEKAQDAATAIASRVPTVYATALIGPAPVSAALVRAHLQMGMTTALRRTVESDARDPTTLLYLARALFEQGRTYFRAQDFQDAYNLLTQILDQTPEAPTKPAAPRLSRQERDDAVLLRALAVALIAGPKDAAEMIAQGPRFAEALGNLAVLDGLAAGQGELAARAAFNAAYLRELVVKPGDPEAWKDLSMRYAAAAQGLKGDEARSARDRASACKAIEKTVRAELTRR